MLLFPVPFLTAFFLVFILLQLAHNNRRGLPPLILVTIACYALQSILLGVNWGISPLHPMVLASLANVLPPLTWLSLNELSGRVGSRARLGIFMFIGGLLLVVNGGFVLGSTLIIDIAGVVIYALFGAHLMWQGWSHELEWMASRPLHSIIPTQRAYFIAGTMLLVSAGVDIMVALDIRMNHKSLSSALVGYSNLTLLLILLFLFFRVGNRVRPYGASKAMSRGGGKPLGYDEAAASEDDDPDSREVIEKLDREMNENHLYRNESLSLNQIARKIGVPARQVSSAVNSLRAMNVPQYVNTFRIKDACRMLEETDEPVTKIVFAVGFTTKSNFNREFQRVTGISPSTWRTQRQAVGMK